MERSTRKRILLTAKLVLAVLLLGWVLSQVHLHDYVQTRDGETHALRKLTPNGAVVDEGWLWWTSGRKVPIDQLEPVDGARQGTDEYYKRRGVGNTLLAVGDRVWVFALAAMGPLLAIILTALRFHGLLHTQDIPIRRWEAIRLTFLGQFFNTIAPGTVGGDLVKAWYIRKHTDRPAATLVTVFLDRVMGLVELTLMATVMLSIVLLAGLEDFATLRPAVIAVAVLAGTTVVALALLFSPALRRLLHLQKIYGRLSIAHHFEVAGEAARLFGRRPWALLRALGMTVLAHAAFIGGIALMGYSIRLEVPFYSYFVYLPLVYLLGAVPITPGGVGLIEKLYVGFFAAVGAGASSVLALALLARFIPAIWSLPGLWVAVTGPKLPKPSEMAAELDAEPDEAEPDPQVGAPGATRPV
jgi:uncharacterized protein (TIRG00374 family)